MGRTLPQAAGGADARDEANDRPAEVSLLHLCVEPQRRIAVETLCEEGSLPLDSLADHVAARRRGLAVSDVPDDVSERVAVGMYHTHLQKLSEAGFVEHSDGERSVVTLSSDLEPDRIRELIRGGHGNWPALGALLSDERRRTVASLLASANGTLSLDALTEAVATPECGGADTPSEADVESVRVSLHHVHLPKLGEAGVLSYDAEGGTVTLESIPDAYESIAADELETVPA